MSKRVFISYSSADRRTAFEVFRLLEKNGCDVWLDVVDIKPAELLDQELASNVAKAEVVCLLLSPTSVASKWVLHEVELALRRQAEGLRLLPLILRPCKIPDLLDNVVGIDVSAGLADEAVQIRLVDAVLNRPRTDEALLLSAGERFELAQQAQRDQVDRDLPIAGQQLQRVSALPIREVVVQIDQDSFPPDQPTILELQLLLDPLWTLPMSFFLAPYLEGSTWPEGFDFAEPPYTEYSQAARPRVACQFRWFDRLEQLVPELDSLDLERCLARFVLRFDGQTFQPGGPQPHLPQRFEIPPLQQLWDKNSRFQLVAHHPRTRTAERVDLQTTDIDIVITACFAQQPACCCLFRSRHRPEDLNRLRCNALASIQNPIEREVLLGLLPRPASTPTDHRGRRLLEALAADQPIAEEDRRFAARLCFGEAQLQSLRGQHLEALKHWQKTAELLEPLVRDGYPSYAEAMLIVRACGQLVDYFLTNKNFARAQDFMTALGIVAERLVQLDPHEPEYQRLWADLLLRNAIVDAQNGRPQQAAEQLKESVATWRRLHAELPSPERLAAQRQALAMAIAFASRWPNAAELPLQDWQAELDAETMTTDA